VDYPKRHHKLCLACLIDSSTRLLLEMNKYRLVVEMNKCLSRGTFGKEILIKVEFDDFCLYLWPKKFVDFCL
jgi:hypothetical protein